MYNVTCDAMQGKISELIFEDVSHQRIYRISDSFLTRLFPTENVVVRRQCKLTFRAKSLHRRE